MISLLAGPLVFGQSKKELKKEQAAEEYEKMKALIESREFIFQADWANSQAGGRIILTTTTNFLKINKDSASIYLPFFGSLYSGSLAITGNSGIEFDGLMEDFQKTVDDEKQKINVKFSASSKNERYDFTMSFFNNGKTHVNLNTNYRSNIKYDGMTKKPKPKE